MFEHTRPKINIANSVNLPTIEAGNYKIFTDPKCRLTSVTKTQSGRHALRVAMEKITSGTRISCDIRTTSGKNYVSSCVTNILEQFGCYKINSYAANATVIVVINEFGYRAPQSCFDSSSSQIVIEDCAYAMGAFINGLCGVNETSFKIFSLSKFLPYQSGGALIEQNSDVTNDNYQLEMNYEQLVAWSELNVKNAHWIAKHIRCSNGLYFEGEQGVPEAAVVRLDLKHEKLLGLKAYLLNVGIEATVFYGTSAIVLPCGHSLSQNQLDYIVSKINAYV